MDDAVTYIICTYGIFYSYLVYVGICCVSLVYFMVNGYIY
jgi:hypothetical protein